MRFSCVLLVLPFVLLGCDRAKESAGEQQPAETAASVAVEEMDGVVAWLEVSNPSEFARPDTLVSLTLNELGVTSGPLQVWQGEAPQATQLVDDDGDGQEDRLVFLTNLEAAQIRDYVIDQQDIVQDLAKRTQAEISIKEGGEWQDKVYVGGTFGNVDQVTNPPQATDHSEYIRYEGPGIESDRVGYRVYLDWRNGFDIFGKKTSDVVLQDVGQDGYDSYHEMSAWGADILKVGDSLGMGGYGYWDGEKAVRVSDVQQQSAAITANGPIYSAFRIDYAGWNTGGAVVDLSASLSMQAGSPMVDVNLHTSEPLENLAIGIVAHPGTDLIMGELDITGEAWSYMASFGEQTLFEDNLGMVLMFRKRDLIEQTRDESSYVLVMQPRGRNLSYAFGALWAGRDGEVQSREDLEAFLLQEVERRTIPPRIRLKTVASEQMNGLAPIDISIRLANSEMERRGDSLSLSGTDLFDEHAANWTYTTGLLMQAMDDLSIATGNPLYAEYARRTMDSFITDDGSIETYDADSFNIDHINSGKMLQRMYAENQDPKYRAAIDSLARQLENHPRTSEGAFWHKQRYPSQLWLDGVYMGMPFQAGVGVMEGNENKIEEAATEFVIARSHLRDPETGLYYHAWDEARVQVWADPETGRSRYVWGRGLGWFAMALVDILDVIPPEETALRKPLLAMIPELAETLVQTQDESGAWFQIMDMPGAAGNYREASATSMFTYFLAKAINEGYLPESYAQATYKAWSGLVNEFVAVHADGSYHLTNVCMVAGLGFGRDGSYRYYMSEPVVANDQKGMGPAIMAGIQVSELSN